MATGMKQIKVWSCLKSQSGQLMFIADVPMCTSYLAYDSKDKEQVGRYLSSKIKAYAANGTYLGWISRAAGHKFYPAK
jgi:hypothetical protein